MVLAFHRRLSTGGNGLVYQLIHFAPAAARKGD
jgi:hypothetical protein